MKTFSLTDEQIHAIGRAICFRLEGEVESEEQFLLRKVIKIMELTGDMSESVLRSF